MTCPKCNGTMETLTIDGIEVDRCTQCKGIWFDFNEHEQLKSKAHQIDIGKANPKGNVPAKIDCPRCKTRMISMAVLGQPHIKYESCTVCHGIFFDAGEFKDFAHKTFGDFLKRLRM